MQLNSLSSHKIALITEVLSNNIIITYFTNDLRQNKETDSVIWQLDKDQVTGTKTIAEFELEKAYEHLITLPELSDFEISEGKNWKLPIKPIRIIIPNNCQVEHILKNDALGQLLIGLRDEFKEQTMVNGDYTYIYVADILPEYLPILESEPLIIIENY